MPEIRAIGEIQDEIDGVNEALNSRPRILDPAIRARLGRRRRDLQNELYEARHRLERETQGVGECAYLPNLAAQEALYWEARRRGWGLDDQAVGDILRLVAPILAKVDTNE